VEVKCKVCGTGRLAKEGSSLICTVCVDEVVAILVQEATGEFPVDEELLYESSYKPEVWWPNCENCGTKMRPAGDYYVCENCGQPAKLKK